MHAFNSLLVTSPSPSIALEPLPYFLYYPVPTRSGLPKGTAPLHSGLTATSIRFLSPLGRAVSHPSLPLAPFLSGQILFWTLRLACLSYDTIGARFNLRCTFRGVIVASLARHRVVIAIKLQFLPNTSPAGL